MSVRVEVAELFREDWAGVPALAGVRVIASERALDDVQQPTALIRLKRIEKLPEAPVSHRRVGLLLTLISAHLDMDEAADDIDGLTQAVLDYLDTRFLHDGATIVGYGDRLAADIPLTITASKE